MTLDEMVAKRKELQDAVAKLDGEIKEHTDLPDEWHIDSGDGMLMASGVTLHGPCCEFEREDQTVSFSLSNGGQYGAVFFMRWENSRSPWIDPEALRAGLRIYDMKEKKKKEERERAFARSRGS